MTEIANYVPGPYQGVSQAPPQVRLAGTCEAMEDCIAVIPQGVQPRPPTNWRAIMKRPAGTSIVGDPNALFEDLPSGGDALDRTLLLNREGGAVKAYLFQTATWAPIAMTVTAAAQAYLSAGSPVPNQDLKVLTVEDTTFINNRLVTVANLGTTATSRPFEGIIWCRTAGYARKTRVTVTSAFLGVSVSATFATHSGSNSNDPYAVGTDKLAKALYDGTNPFPGNCDPNPSPLTSLGGSGFTVTLDGSLIYISHPSADFTISIADDAGGAAVTAVKGSVQRFSDLPAVAQSGFTVRVAQEAAGGNSDYYVAFVAGSASTLGTWKEVIAPGANLGVDPATMPVGIRFVGGAWTLDVLPFTGRTTGTVTLSPDPGFVGDQITRMGWWRGRLAVLYNSGVLLSASDSPFKFYTTTLAASLDSDPLGFLPPVGRKVFFKDLITFDERLVVFGDKGQGVIAAQQVIAASQTKITTLAEANYSDQIPLQKCGHKVYFAFSKAASFVINELAIDRLSGLALPDSQSAAVPTYLPSTIDRACTDEDDFITVYGTSGATRMFFHIFRHAQQEQKQNAWMAWNLPSGWLLAGMYMKGCVLRMALIDPTGYLNAVDMNLAPDTLDPGGTVLSHLDIRATEAAATSAVFDGVNTVFAFPFPITNGSCSIRAPTVTPTEGHRITGVTFSLYTMTVPGNWIGRALWFGHLYSAYFIPSKWYKLGQDQMPERSGRLTIQRVKVDVARLGYLRIETTIRGRSAQVPFEGYLLDDPSSPIDAAPIQPTAILSVPISGRNEDVSCKFISDNVLGFKITGYEWIGSWNPRAQRVT